MTKTMIVITLLAGVLLVSGCANPFSEWCRLSQGLGQVLNK